MNIKGAYIVPHPPMIIPDIGRGNEKQIFKTIQSYNNISDEIKKINPDTIIISSPHAPYYRESFYLSDGDIISGDFSKFNAFNISFTEEIDHELVDIIYDLSCEKNFPVSKKSDVSLDHGTMIPLYFIRKKISHFKIIVLGISDLSYLKHYQMGEIIQEACSKLNRKVVYIASGDLSHRLKEYGPYGFTPEGPIYDCKIVDDCSNARFDQLFTYSKDLLHKAQPCGHWSFLMMAGVLDGYQVNSKFYSYEDITGVGYTICSYYPKEQDLNRCFAEQFIKQMPLKKSKDPYVLLAQETIYHYILYNHILSNEFIDHSLLNEKAGVFVSIHKNGELRGCIGTFLPVYDSIGEEIIYNAISAATRDNRFLPITDDELTELDINIDILSTPEFIDSKDQLNPKKYGVIVTSGMKRGLLLPDLEGIDDIDTQIDIAMKKGGISYQESVKLQRFEVSRHT